MEQPQIEESLPVLLTDEELLEHGSEAAHPAGEEINFDRGSRPQDREGRPQRGRD